MTNMSDDAEQLDDTMRLILRELGGRLESEPSGSDECAIQAAVKKALLRGHDLGIVSGTAQANALAQEKGFELAVNPVVGASADAPDEWMERFGGDD